MNILNKFYEREELVNFEKLKTILESGTKQELDEFCEINNLVIKDGKIFHNDTEYVKDQLSFWDKRQLVKKINLNA